MRMAYDNDTLNQIYDRTNGRCHICGKKLSFVNYARPRRRGAWEVEHSNPKVKGGTNYLRNLFPACINCNREKGTIATRTARTWHGRKRAPLSKEKKKKAKRSNAIIGGVVGGLFGLIAGPWGVAAGVAIGHSIDPDK